MAAPVYPTRPQPAPQPASNPEPKKETFNIANERALAAKSRGIELGNNFLIRILGRSKVVSKTLLGG